MVTPALEGILLPVGHTVVWVEADIDSFAHLPGKCWRLVEALDIPVRTVDEVGMFAGTAEVEVDLP